MEVPNYFVTKTSKFQNQFVHYKSSESMSELGDGVVALTVTSPPYWNLKDYGHENQIGQEPYESYLDRLNTVWDECYRVSSRDAILVVNVGNRRFEKRYYPLAMDIYRTMHLWKLIDILVWYIPNALPQPKHYIDSLFDNKYENVLVFAKDYEYHHTFNKIRVQQKYAARDHRKDKYHPDGRCIGNVFRIPAYRPPNVKDGSYHGAAFPEELVYLLVTAFSNPGDLILDPFAGSGTTMKVAHTFGRRGVGYEINAALRPTIERRIRELWTPPDFETIDIIMSSTATQNSSPGRRRPPSGLVQVKPLDYFIRRRGDKSF